MNQKPGGDCRASLLPRTGFLALLGMTVGSGFECVCNRFSCLKKPIKLRGTGFLALLGMTVDAGFGCVCNRRSCLKNQLNQQGLGPIASQDDSCGEIGALALAGCKCQIHLAHETNRHPFSPDKSGGSDRLKPVLRLAISQPRPLVCKPRQTRHPERSEGSSPLR